MTLSQTLNMVADKLDAGTVEYSWWNPQQCNCGVVAQAILGISRSKLDKFLDRYEGGTWEGMVNEVCPMTGRPTARIFAELHDAGLTRDDLIHLERLSDPNVLALLPKTHIVTVKKWFRKPKQEVRQIKYKKSHVGDLSQYLRALAKLKEEEPVEQPTNRMKAMSLN